GCRRRNRVNRRRSTRLRRRQPYSISMKACAPLILALVAVSCASAHKPYFATAHLNRLHDFVRMQPYVVTVDSLTGAVPLHDGGAVDSPELAISRAVLHTNPRIEPMNALYLA